MKTKQKECNPTEHQYQQIDFTPRVSYTGYSQVGGFQEPKYKLYCIKCGKIVDL